MRLEQVTAIIIGNAPLGGQVWVLRDEPRALAGLSGHWRLAILHVGAILYLRQTDANNAAHPFEKKQVERR